MSQYHVGQTIQKRCRTCLHDEAKVIKVDRKDLNEKEAVILWSQCPECGSNDNELIPGED
ncbi:hypothetical protein [Halobacillus naozhouensis]|uniref:SR1 protein n=1 Tax=Halobacillus naozhouensis TaxID=554880 RepID=A0ABY8IYK2_9BACI|nr:hypothetical protein [Halobacillus naozhouensis]WFT73625.1 hypothetical protein P9989_14760 [Halobacillus naozhouensis]